MKILICGATGFIGRHFVNDLVHQGEEVVVLTRNETKAKRILPSKVTFHEWKHPFNSLPPKSAFKSIQAVVNLAGENIASRRWSSSWKKRMTDSRVLLTEKLMEALDKYTKKSVKVYIGASAVGFYEKNAEEVLDENSSSCNGFLSRLCASWEEASLKAAYPKRKVIFRIATVISDEGGIIKKLSPMFRLGLGAILGSGKQWLSWIHLEDLCLMMREALSQAKYKGIYNASAPHFITNKTFSKSLAKRYHRFVFFRVPAFFLKLLLGEMADLLLSSQKVYPKKLLSQGFRFRYSNLSKGFKSLLENA